MPKPFTTGAMLRYKQGDLEGALQDYSEAIRLKPDFDVAAADNRDFVRKAIGDRSKT